MAVETDTERSIFFNSSEFASSASYTPVGGSASTISGIFDDEHQSIDAGGLVTVSSSSPVFQTLTSSVPSAAEGDTLVVSSTTYKVRVVMPDGTGTTMLQLEKQ